MGFYEDFIEKYDTLVSFENRLKRERDFFQTLFSAHNVKRVLDCACGTGQQVIMFDKLGYSAKGSDLSPAMIHKAKFNAKKHGVDSTFKVADFRYLSKTFNEKFDAVICEGNSLPHLLNDKDLSKALSEMYKLLNTGGILVVEQRNYDMLVSQKKRFFPMSIRENEAFFYVLDYFPEKIVFNVIDFEIKNRKFNVFSSEYNPLHKSHLGKLLLKSGFKNLKYFGNYKCDKFDVRKDERLIVVCEK